MSNDINPTRDLRLFQSIAARQGDRMIFGGTRDPASLRHVRNNAFGRAATWVRKSLGTGHESSVDDAYTRFSGALRSIRTHASAQDLARVDAQLETDRRAGKPLSSRRVGQVLSELGTQVARGVTSGAPPADPSRARYQMLAEAARKGIDAARANLAEASGDLVDADECLSKLRSGDGGLRRGTTALSNLQHHLKPEMLAPNTLQGTTAQWQLQTARITGMAGQLANACFSDALDANFLQYGNSDNPFSNVVDHFRDLDRPVRSWLAEGLELADALLRAQEGAGEGKPPLDPDALDGLQRRVDAFADSAARLASPNESWSDEVLAAVFGASQGPTTGRDDLATAPSTGPTRTGAQLAANFDRAGAIGKLDQEIELQRQEVDRLAQGGAEPGDMSRAQAELDARVLSRDELVVGRDPRDALRSRRDELTARFGADDPRARAYGDTVDYFTAAGAFAEVGVGAGRVPDFVDTSRTLSEWRQRLAGLQARGESLRPRTPAEIERAEAYDNVSGFMQQAIVETSSGRDPRPELIRHAVDLERQEFVDGGKGDGEATLLRAMAKEFTHLVQASQARQDAAGGP